MSLIGRVEGRLRAERAARRVSPIARQVVAERLTYLSWPKLSSLERCLTELRREGVEGDVIEAGIAMGGSAIVLAQGMGPGRSFHGYDVFGMIPPPSEHDDAHTHERYKTIASGKARGLGDDDYYGYQDDLYDRVVGSLESHGVPVDGERVALHRGLFEDTLRPDKPIALAHIDCDWYEPVRLCFERIHPHLSPGGFIVLDDFFDYAGCARATHEYLAAHDDLRMIRAPGNAVIKRMPAG